LKIEGENNFKLNFSDVPAQKSPLHRCVYTNLMLFLNKKSFVGNWHIYGVHRKHAIQDIYSKIPKNQKYSNSLEQFLLTLLFVRKPSVFIENICSVHDNTNMKNKFLEDGGYSGWKETKDYSKFYKKELANYLNKQEIEFFLNFRQGNINYRLPNNFVFRKKIFKYICINPFENNNIKSFYALKKILLLLVFIFFSIFILRNYKNIFYVNKKNITQHIIDILSVKNYSLLKDLYNGNLYKSKEFKDITIKII